MNQLEYKAVDSTVDEVTGATARHDVKENLSLIAIAMSDNVA